MPFRSTVRVVLIGVTFASMACESPGSVAEVGGQRWRVDRTTRLRIGTFDGPTETTFGRVAQVEFFDNGSLAIVDHAPPRIVIVDSEGQVLRSVGRAGQGPGEFEVAPRIAVDSTGRITAWDPMARRLTWFDSLGNIQEERRVAARLPDKRSPQVWRVAPDGTVITWDTSPDAGWTLLALPPSGLPRPVVRLPLPSTGQTPPLGPGRVIIQIQSPFLAFPRAVVGGRPTRIFVADLLEWAVRVYSADAELKGSFGPRAFARLPVTKQMIDHARDSVASSHGSLDPIAIEAAFDDVAHPDSVSAIKEAHWDRSGLIWLESMTPSQPGTRELHAFTPDGEREGAVTIPLELGSVAAIRDRRLAMIWRDALGVSFVDVYRLTPDLSFSSEGR